MFTVSPMRPPIVNKLLAEKSYSMFSTARYKCITKECDQLLLLTMNKDTMMLIMAKGSQCLQVVEKEFVS
jgi:hypothetical protein